MLSPIRRMFRQFLFGLIRGPLMLILQAGGSFGGAPGIDPTKVAIYIRWSTDDQGSGTTLDVQRDACLHQAMAWGLGQVPQDRVFIDDGYSGGNLERPAVTRLRHLVRQGEVSCVIVYKIDRLSRNIVDATGLVLNEWDGSCHLRCVMEPVDTTTELGRMIFSILAMFADFERSAIRARTFSGKVRRAQEGRNPGIRLPYGYRHGEQKGEIVVDESQAAVVRRIFAEYAAGKGPYGIARDLNADNIPPRFGGEAWAKATIQKIVRNEAYIGRMIWGRSTKNKRHGKAEGETVRIQLDEPLVVKDGVFPVIVDPILFQRVQQLREQKHKSMEHTSGRALASEYLLTGLAQCRCGHRFQAWQSVHRNKRGLDIKPVYICHGRRAKGAAFCNCGQIHQEALDQVVADEVRKLTRPETRAAIIAQFAAGARKRIDSLEVQLAETDARLKGLDAEEARLRRDYRSEKISAGSYELMRTEIEQERQQLTARKQRQQVELAGARSSGEEQSLVELAISELQDWDRLDMLKRKQLLRDLILELTAYRPSNSKELQVDLKFRVLDEPISR